MKKVLITLFLIIITFSGILACSKNTFTSVTPYTEHGANYEIIDNTKYHRPMFQYYIYDNNNEIIDQGVTYAYPKISNSEGLLRLSIETGEYIRCCKYYDIQRKLYSVWFINPLAQNGTVIAYTDIPMGATKLVVQDIFDKSKYYRAFERFFYDKYYPVSCAEFINGGKQLLVKYDSDLNKHEIEILDLYP